MRIRAIGVAVATAGLVLMSTTPAFAGGDKTSNAPQLVVGQNYGGTTWVNSSSVMDIWRLPPLLISDSVVIAAANDAYPSSLSEPQRMCLAGNVDDFSWYDNWCNLASSNGFTGYGTRMTFYAKANAADAFVEVFRGDWNRAGAYHFTLEAIRHKVMTSITVSSTVSATAKIPLSANYTNGAAVAGKKFTLTATWTGEGEWSTTATTDSAGHATFQLSLPTSAQGKTVSFVATAPETTNQQAASSAASQAAVTAAKVQLRVRAWRYAHKGKIECDVDPNVGLEWSVQLQKLRSGSWVNYGAAKATGVNAHSTHQKWNPKKGTYRVVVFGKGNYLGATSGSVKLKR